MFFAFLSIVAIFINPGIIGTMTSAVLFGIHLGKNMRLFEIHLYTNMRLDEINLDVKLRLFEIHVDTNMTLLN